MEIALIIAIVAMVAIFLEAKKKPSQWFSASEIPRLAGNGHFAVEVVGESNYTYNFEAICGPRSRDGVNIETRALLVMENSNPHDRNAVRVSIQGLTVGYLSRGVALDFRRAIRAAGQSKHQVFDCAAVIRGGWDNGRGKQGYYGVWLDIPQSQ